MTEKTESGKNGGRRPGSGRKKGVPNKLNGQLKDMILGALEEAGGQTYLANQAKESPAAFMALVGKVLPMTVLGSGDKGEFVLQAPWLTPAVAARNSE